ncbi:MAG: L-lactate dehydrogenase [Deltaproteobacteria bacterium HGW-Deltaproteobacteria-7]|nr:MAG: L-lactate dehydrogenase [Deltaproteobacteria bacterium HGW-Deltaproteobacteria-7]
MSNKVAIVGTGNVGATLAYSLLNSGLANEIVLIDRNLSKAEGEAMDLNHAVPMAKPTKIYAGDYSNCFGAAITVVTAGAAQKPGETRLDLAAKNTEIIKDIILNIVKFNPQGLILIATNPVDILTYAAIKYSGLSPKRVFGSGTILDTARFRYLLSQRFEVDSRSVHATIIGEHGDSEVPVWSLANIAGMQLSDYCIVNHMGCDKSELKDIFEKTRDAAYHIIERKGATFYAIASGLVKILEAILRDQSTVLSVSSLISNYYDLDDVCFSLPTVIDRGGIERVIKLKLSEEEKTGLIKSARVLQETIKQLGLN